MEKLDPSYFDWSKSLVSLSNAILAHYGHKTFHEPLKEALDLLKGHRKVAVFLFDALGRDVIDAHLKEAHILKEHAALEVTSTNPPTTVAATTAFLTGKCPIETAYLGWAPYFEEKGFAVEVFPNTRKDTKEKLPGPNLLASLSPQKRLDDLLKEAGVKARLVFPEPIDPEGPETPEGEYLLASRFFDEGGEFAYTYFPEPDKTLHEEGVGSKKVGKAIKRLLRGLSKFVSAHPDVLVLTLADHGMINVTNRDLAAYPELVDCLRRPLSLEGRTASLCFKEGRAEEFLTRFGECFPSFVLIKGEDAVERGFFGQGSPHPLAPSMIGDYLALAVKEDLLVNSLDGPVHPFKGHHAGGTPAERYITVAAFNR